MKTYGYYLLGFGILLLALGGMFSSVLPSRAFEPSLDYWFIETFTLEAVELPIGVTLHASDPSTEARGTLTLENQTDTLLFLLSLNYKDVLVMATPDAIWKTRVRGAHEVASYLAAPTKPAYLNMEALTDLDQHLVDRNVLSLDPPPADVAIPPSQDSELLLVYGEQVFVVPFTVSYALNAQFDNGSGANTQWMATAQATDNASATATQRATPVVARLSWNNILLIVLASAAELLILIWLVWRIVVWRGRKSQ